MDQSTVVPEVSAETKLSRRRLLKIIAATGGAVAASTLLPSKWARPVIDVGLLPAHAQVSPGQWLSNLEANWTGRMAEVCCGGHSGYILRLQFDYCPPPYPWDGDIYFSFSGGTAGDECASELDGGASLSGAAEAPGECDHYDDEWCVYFDDREKVTFTVKLCALVDGKEQCETKSITVNKPD
jgi:hypothetical protein